MRTMVTHFLRATTAAVVMALFLPTSGLAQAHVHPAAPSTEVQAATRAIEALFAAAERGDLRALDTLYAGDSLLVIEGAGINRGWADYRDNHLAPELKQFTNFRYRPFEIEARVVGEVAWVTYRYALMAEIGERRVDSVGRGTAILEKARRPMGGPADPDVKPGPAGGRSADASCAGALATRVKPLTLRSWWRDTESHARPSSPPEAA